MHIVILTGGEYEESFLQSFFLKETVDYVIAVDGGLDYSRRLGITVDEAVGDFDTVSLETLKAYEKENGKFEKFSPYKDYSDTHLAILKAIEKKPSSITILCGLGGRMDHALATIFNLVLPLKEHIPCSIQNERNKITMTDHKLICKKSKQHGKYVSLLPFSPKVEGITLKGFLYPLEKATICQGESIGISNELIEDEGEITLEKGILIVVEAKD